MQLIKLAVKEIHCGLILLAFVRHDDEASCACRYACTNGDTQAKVHDFAAPPGATLLLLPLLS
jgi:hypothetical protein